MPARGGGDGAALRLGPGLPGGAIAARACAFAALRLLYLRDFRRRTSAGVSSGSGTGASRRLRERFPWPHHWSGKGQSDKAMPLPPPLPRLGPWEWDVSTATL